MPYSRPRRQHPDNPIRVGSRQHVKPASSPSTSSPDAALSCFICQQANISSKTSTTFEHKTESISVCNPCYVKHCSNEGKWHTSEPNGNPVSCEICGDSGELINCDDETCKAVYCTICLRYLLGQKQLDVLLNDEEIPFVCFTAAEKTNLAESFPIYSDFVKERQNMPSKQQEEEDLVDKLLYHDRASKLKSIKPFTCFACFKKSDMDKDNLPKLHKLFKVTLCNDCDKFLEGDDWTMTDGKNDYCVISGEGGEILSCDTKNCTNSFSMEILKQWIGKKQVLELQDDEDLPFKCFQCDENLGNYQKFKKMSEKFMTAFEKSENGGTTKRKIIKPVRVADAEEGNGQSLKMVSSDSEYEPDVQETGQEMEDDDKMEDGEDEKEIANAAEASDSEKNDNGS